MLLNCFAFGVNSFGISPQLNIMGAQTHFELFVLTDRTKELPAQNRVGQNEQDLDGFWPFEHFYVEAPGKGKAITGRFRGLFTGFDLSEFLFYNLLIASIYLFFKLW